jgi:dihydrofolate synthase/folylpolyglutamate synthase
MNYNEALEYIHGISWTFCKPGLERISELCEKLSHPEKKLKFIHVAGTNGKGSFCSMLSSILIKAGYRVGLYTSPYIKVFNERMRVNGENIKDEVLADITAKVRPIAESMTDKPTEFELITAIAFQYFYEEKCDVVVLEAGMGGRLDSTNVIDTPVLSVITGIALDHTDYLGDTIEKIAKEKAGIIKPKVPVLYGGEDKNARAVIEEVAKEKGSDFYLTSHAEIKNIRPTLSETLFDYKDEKDIAIKLLGEYQPKNAASVIEATKILNAFGYNISSEALRQGLASASWPARFEIINSAPLVIFDGAHNPEGISSAVESIKNYFKGDSVHVFTGVLRDKDYRFIAKKISEVADSAFVITPESPRALQGSEYAKILSENGVFATAYNTFLEAITAAVSSAKKNNKPLICLGSLYTYQSVTDAISKI